MKHQMTFLALTVWMASLPAPRDLKAAATIEDLIILAEPEIDIEEDVVDEECSDVQLADGKSRPPRCIFPVPTIPLNRQRLQRICQEKEDKCNREISCEEIKKFNACIARECRSDPNQPPDGVKQKCERESERGSRRAESECDRLARECLAGRAPNWNPRGCTYPDRDRYPQSCR